MATLSTCKRTGSRRILLNDATGKRRQLYLGKMDESTARAVFDHVEHLAVAERAGVVPQKATAAWLMGIGDDLHERLARVGLVEPRKRRHATTLAQLIERFEEAANVAPATLAAYQQTFNSLLEHFGEDKPIATVTVEGAARWRRAQADAGYAKATQAKRTFVAKLIFGRALAWGLIEANPFAELKAGTQSNPDRSHYVSVEHAERVIAACPDARWRAIVGLCRFAGLRCPSELSALTWGDVDLLERRLVVKSPKTRHHEGHALRVVPIVPLLAALLEDLYQLAEPGDVELFPRLEGSANLRTTMSKIVGRAGLSTWPRLFQNMRASCATDWVAEFPNKDVASWLGHSPLVAAVHYLRPRDEHFKRATGMDSAHESAQNTTRQGAADIGTKRKPKAQDVEDAGFMPVVAGACRNTPNGGMGEEGFEPPKALASRFTVCPRWPLGYSPAGPRVYAIRPLAAAVLTPLQHP